MSEVSQIPAEGVQQPQVDPIQQQPGNIQAFLRAFNEYKSILNESSQNYIDNREQIMQIYQSRISEIDNYSSMRNDLITQESRFRAQLASDLVED